MSCTQISVKGACTGVHTTPFGRDLHRDCMQTPLKWASTGTCMWVEYNHPRGCMQNPLKHSTKNNSLLGIV